MSKLKTTCYLVEWSLSSLKNDFLDLCVSVNFCGYVVCISGVSTCVYQENSLSLNDTCTIVRLASETSTVISKWH